jgi:hypothetical protein
MPQPPQTSSLYTEASYSGLARSNAWCCSRGPQHNWRAPQTLRWSGTCMQLMSQTTRPLLVDDKALLTEDVSVCCDFEVSSKHRSAPVTLPRRAASQPSVSAPNSGASTRQVPPGDRGAHTLRVTQTKHARTMSSASPWQPAAKASATAATGCKNRLAMEGQTESDRLANGQVRLCCC